MLELLRGIASSTNLHVSESSRAKFHTIIYSETPFRENSYHIETSQFCPPVSAALKNVFLKICKIPGEATVPESIC